jgi:transposase
MIERHWDCIVSYCNPNNKVSLGLVEGINNKVRVIQRRAYGIKDCEYLKLKVLSSFLPSIVRLGNCGIQVSRKTRKEIVF